MDATNACLENCIEYRILDAVYFNHQIEDTQKYAK